jgi:hypothetical protein
MSAGVEMDAGYRVVYKFGALAPISYTYGSSMFVRWQSRKRATPEFGGWGKPLKNVRYRGRHGISRRGSNKQDVHWAATLVESVRVEGKPAPRHVAYLGGITESAIEIAAQRCFFWDKVTEHLDGLHNRLSPEDRQRIESAIAKKVAGPPTKEERARLDREREEILGDLKAL